ncbi:PKD domain-containing protein [Plebeiibacterium marinum]|uniref:PKD domain-containing protein n=1 Tax=Plebeiibacterium marinum TaxID=2992111 RepID=A0AAE3MB25_9BACT|nr:PKD domain-containing protein [Plebeiobacterium marinum]MCW3804166.1 PKD domain-containing protein [Plebeiobacterium marinum]
MFVKILSIVLFAINVISIYGQHGVYTVERAGFSSGRYDEFSPVYYKNGIVFCSNRGSVWFQKFSNSKNLEQFSIYYIEKDKSNRWRKAVLFSKELDTQFNDGPASFDCSGDVVFFSRNIFVNSSLEKNTYNSNRLGVFSASRYDGRWTRIREFQFNNDWYNVTTPCLSKDGERLFFASDKPGGMGGMDIYYSDKKSGLWGDPINMGPKVNTEGNELYPFINDVGELYFASDGYGGYGGKDIYITKQNGNDWYDPVHLPGSLNSKSNDFGIVTDGLGRKGYFSSDRGKTVDIYEFSTVNRDILYSVPQVENDYRVMLQDSCNVAIDTFLLQHEWEFEDGTKLYGAKVCRRFDKIGSYKVKLNIVDRSSHKLFMQKSEYLIKVNDIEQPYINSRDFFTVGESALFDGLKSNCQDYEVVDYYWQIGDSTYSTGSNISHVFQNVGIHNVKLEVVFKSKIDESLIKKSVYKSIRIFNNTSSKDEFLKNKSEAYDLTRRYKSNHTISDLNFIPCDVQPSVFRLVLFSSKNRVSLHSQVFRNIPEKFDVIESYDQLDKIYSYWIDEQYDLMDLYLTYKNLLKIGDEGYKVEYIELNDPVKIELYKIVNKYGNCTDDYFNDRNILKTNGILVLNKVIGLLHKNPKINIKIKVHTDNKALPSQNKYLSQMQAQRIFDYITGTGIKSDRLVVVGVGDEIPVASNESEVGRRKNRRVEFRLVNNR